MEIALFGAAGDVVTGSAYHIKGAAGEIMLDFGAFQGEDSEHKNKFPREINAKQLSSVLVTHGHLDHVGRLPLLIQQQYKGPLFATPATIEMASIILRDAAKIQKNGYSEEELYSPEEVEQLLKRFKTIPYEKWYEIPGGFLIKAVDSGHMLGSVSYMIKDSKSGVIASFSGDIGPRAIPYLNDFTPCTEGSFLFLESTYGDRDHKLLASTVEELSSVIRQAYESLGKVVIPAFAVGRTQQLIYHLAELTIAGAIPELPVYIDSPMAAKANQIYVEHQELFDKDTTTLIHTPQFRSYLKNVHTCQNIAESKALNSYDGPCIIIAGSGMCSGGRILHHLLHHMGQENTHILIVGYQATGTLGRRLVEGARDVIINGIRVENRATVHTLGGFSAHAGQTELVEWAQPLAKQGTKIALVHGEHNQREILKNKLYETYSVDVRLPAMGDVISL